MEGQKLSEIELLEKEIERLAKELNIQEKHVKRFFDGTYTSISLTKKSKKREVILLSQIAHDGSGKVNNPFVKSTREDNYEVIKKMEKFVKLVRAYMAFRKAEEWKAKARENLAVALAS